MCFGECLPTHETLCTYLLLVQVTGRTHLDECSQSGWCIEETSEELSTHTMDSVHQNPASTYFNQFVDNPENRMWMILVNGEYMLPLNLSWWLGMGPLRAPSYFPSIVKNSGTTCCHFLLPDQTSFPHISWKNCLPVISDQIRWHHILQLLWC